MIQVSLKSGTVLLVRKCSLRPPGGVSEPDGSAEVNTLALGDPDRGMRWHSLDGIWAMHPPQELSTPAMHCALLVPGVGPGVGPLHVATRCFLPCTEPTSSCQHTRPGTSLASNTLIGVLSPSFHWGRKDKLPCIPKNKT